MRENMPTRKCCRGLDARKFSSTKICTFTVYLVIMILGDTSGWPVYMVTEKDHNETRCTK